MNLLFRVIFASACTSTHHKLAMDALCHLRGRRVTRWRNLFLKHHKVYLEGSKAPDKKFKDFRNHVLHVRDNFWGGAPKTARAWFERTVEALRKENWVDVVYSAGVLSHYYTDPIQPFHTGQSQEESNIHRAAEWSITKSYDEIRAIVLHRLGYPEVEIKDGPAWLEQMVIDGAKLANPHYETLITHYDFNRGRKDPPAGLDDLSREILAQLIAHATVGFARILERAFEESGATPPRTEVSLETFLATVNIPINWVTKKMADAEERKIVKAMYNELAQTGKVDRTLSEDDRTIRDLHEKEVLSRAKNSGQERPQPNYRAPVPSKPQLPQKPKVDKPRQETIKLHNGIESPPATAPKKAETKRPERDLKFYLEMSSNVVDAPSIGPKTARRLAKIKVKTVSDLLALDPEQASAKIGQRYITPTVITAWQDQARLVCQIPQLRGHDAAVLVACGLRDPVKIASSDPNDLFSVIEPFVESSDGQRIIRNGKNPDLNEIKDWIEWAGHWRPLKAA